MSTSAPVPQQPDSKSAKGSVNGWSYQILVALLELEGTLTPIGGPDSAYSLDEIQTKMAAHGMKVSQDFVKGSVDRMIDSGLIRTHSLFRGVYEIHPNARATVTHLQRLPDLWKPWFREKYREYVILAALEAEYPHWLGAEDLTKRTGMSVSSVRSACRELRDTFRVRSQRVNPGANGRLIDEFQVYDAPKPVAPPAPKAPTGNHGISADILDEIVPLSTKMDLPDSKTLLPEAPEVEEDDRDDTLDLVADKATSTPPMYVHLPPHIADDLSALARLTGLSLEELLAKMLVSKIDEMSKSLRDAL